MRKPRNSSELFHAWAHQHFPEARSGNVSFDGPRVYSYRACIAQILPSGAVAHSYQHWSPTTSGHQSDARLASRHMPAVFCYDPGSSVAWNKQFTEDSIQRMMLNLPLPELRKDGVETVNSQKRRENAKADILRKVNQFNEYLLASGEKIKPIKLPADLEKEGKKLRAAEEKRQKAEKKRREGEIKRRDEEAREALGRWRKHENNSVSIRTSTPALRMSKDGLWVETSWGARVPTEDAKRIWPLIFRIKARGVAFTNSDRSRIGDFILNEVKPDGTVVVGCHTIAWEEIEHIAVTLGLKEGAPV